MTASLSPTPPLVTPRKEAGPFLSRDEVRPILQLDEAGFEKIKYYLRTREMPTAKKLF
ncbi:MAG: hypothetical protein H0W08_17170 [Acidobacteria bacterium]|nr:hypothetical protein [Acidobacteriota bacterium]